MNQTSPEMTHRPPPSGLWRTVFRALAVLSGVLLLPAVVGTPVAGCVKKSDDTKDKDQKVKKQSFPDGVKSHDPGAGATIDAEERQTLLSLARRSLVSAVSGTHPRALTDGLMITDRLKKKQGAFVTLKIGKRLRGCIGTILPELPLYQAVIANAKNAALRDRRFRPVSMAEVADVWIELSALSVPERVDSYKEIKIGTHGMIMKRGYNSATYLPHVAPEQKWDLDTTLAHLSRKAGLSTQAYQEPDIEYWVYTAEVWAEKGGH
ncbi:AmmeMemoRadiSam system protein A [Myxococcota bacterium]